MTESRVVQFKTEHPPRLIIEGFPDHKETIEMLWDGSEEFREVCADFVTARVSMERAEQSDHGSRTVERYEELVEELRLELRTLLSAFPRNAT
jgi:hypothetical protein